MIVLEVDRVNFSSTKYIGRCRGLGFTTCLNYWLRLQRTSCITTLPDFTITCQCRISQSPIIILFQILFRNWTTNGITITFVKVKDLFFFFLNSISTLGTIVSSPSKFSSSTIIILSYTFSLSNSTNKSSYTSSIISAFVTK